MHTEQNTGIIDHKHSKQPSGNSGELRALIELEGNFIIPGYQRGYRWNDQQIYDFLNDIFEFYEQFKNGKENKIYFLQPVVVMENYNEGTDNDEKENEPEINIVDGQQRLTTVLLLNAVLLNPSNNYVPKNIDYRKSIKKQLDRDAIYYEFFDKAIHYIFSNEVEAKNDKPRRNINKNKFINYTLTINTRNESDEFLKRIAKGIEPTEKECDSIDLYFLFNAHDKIRQYIDEKNKKGINWIEFYRIFANQVKVLWYAIDNSDSSGEIAAFTRLNSGKIPLTNAELSRAALLNPAYYKSKDNKDDNQNLPDIETERGLISIGWDNLEYELRKPEFWGFLGFSENDCSSNVKDQRNKSFEDERYQTRIDFLLDFHFSQKNKDNTKNKDEDNTENSNRDRNLPPFIKLEKKLKDAKKNNFSTNNVKQIWESIQLDLWKLQTWYDDNDLYHWIGYLFAEKRMNPDLFSKFKDLKKDELKEEVKGYIASFYRDLDTALEYTYDTNEPGCERLLFLYNVEYVRSMKTTGTKHRYDFSAHHQKKWTIEHINAQNVEGLNTKEQWLIWLKSHRGVLDSRVQIEENKKNELIGRVNELIDKLERSEQSKSSDLRDEFLRLSNEIVEKINDVYGIKDLHELSNLALLDGSANSVLNNSIFRVKQNKIIEEMKQGNFIPPATQAVFLRLFSMEEQDHLYWTANDRKAYLGDIKEKLTYLLG
ncbi:MULTISPECIES: DUF262 domain-containing protein [Bartonella]|uniref:DUF262 domain-containing protein n=1 Tax=Bartonella TaxID=773 RepID=UPI0018DD14DC|nr:MULTISPECIES: DUF262 domain-containing protein [Bartonella]MBH9994763.1 DUF262 domain-containing protein [Bartonella sp. P0291]MBH9996892.1 DUF262 domain-containing protein [Bartonella sp. M0192]MBH9999052.1 DUF262 domain-containing protein [Bartonella sp. M0191]MBI0007432.1 DUF262 domain-containing protein [Bartonella sp. M0193]MBI0010343.1 DUF262 domain-containing protein [Bartonella sp. M0176]